MLNKLEKKIAAYFDRDYCIIVGSGTTALYVILKALELPENSNVIYPDITCETAINAAIYAGHRPLFCDIDLNAYNLDPEKAVELLARHKASVMVPTHIFGNIMDIPALRNTLKEKELFIIEDAAQAFGGELDGIKAGNMGDASIMSFGKDKIIDCGGGGVVLTDSYDFYKKCIKVSESLNGDPSFRETLKKEIMKEMFTLNKVVKDRREFIKKRDELKKRYKDAYLFKAEEEVVDKISKAFENIDDVIKKRKINANLLANILSKNAYVDIPISFGNPMYWRYSFRVCKNRDVIFNELLREKINVSKLFNPLHTEYDVNDDEYPNSIALKKKVLNVWLDFEEDSSDIVNEIDRVIKKYGAR